MLCEVLTEPVSHGSTPTSQKTRLEYYEFRPQSNRAVLKEYYVWLLTPNQTAALFLINDHTTAQVAARPVVVCYCASSIRHHKVLDSANWHLLGSQLGNSCIVIQWGRLPFNYCWGDPPLQVVVKFHYLLRQGPLKCCGIQWLWIGLKVISLYKRARVTSHRPKAILRIELCISVLFFLEPWELCTNKEITRPYDIFQWRDSEWRPSRTSVAN